MGDLDPNVAYDCAFTPLGDMIIVEMDNVEPSTEEVLLNSIVEGLQRGDYYPERIRRLVGH
jgi:hypothetical protein